MPYTLTIVAPEANAKVNAGQDIEFKVQLTGNGDDAATSLTGKKVKLTFVGAQPATPPADLVLNASGGASTKLKFTAAAAVHVTAMCSDGIPETISHEVVVNIGDAASYILTIVAPKANAKVNAGQDIEFKVQLTGNGDDAATSLTGKKVKLTFVGAQPATPPADLVLNASGGASTKLKFTAAAAVHVTATCSDGIPNTTSLDVVFAVEKATDPVEPSIIGTLQDLQSHKDVASIFSKGNLPESMATDMKPYCIKMIGSIEDNNKPVPNAEVEIEIPDVYKKFKVYGEDGKAIPSQKDPNRHNFTHKLSSDENGDIVFYVASTEIAIIKVNVRYYIKSKSHTIFFIDYKNAVLSAPTSLSINRNDIIEIDKLAEHKMLLTIPNNAFFQRGFEVFALTEKKYLNSKRIDNLERDIGQPWIDIEDTDLREGDNSILYMVEGNGGNISQSFLLTFTGHYDDYGDKRPDQSLKRSLEQPSIEYLGSTNIINYTLIKDHDGLILIVPVYSKKRPGDTISVCAYANGWDHVGGKQVSRHEIIPLEPHLVVSGEENKTQHFKVPLEKINRYDSSEKNIFGKFYAEYYIQRKGETDEDARLYSSVLFANLDTVPPGGA